MGKAADALEPRIYVACLAAYNSGQLHGAWIDVEDDADAVRAQIYSMLVNSPVRGAEEYAIHDYEDFGEVTISEYAGIDRLVEMASFLRERGNLGAAVLEYLSGDVEAARSALDDQYHGVFASLADCFEELTQETTQIPDNLRNYIDWEAVGRDAELNGDVFTVKTGHDEVHVFWGR